jgi:hypothetical protein
MCVCAPASRRGRPPALPCDQLLRLPHASYAPNISHPVRAHPPAVPQNQTDPWIHPGKFNPLPVKPWDGRRALACEWQEWALSPPPEHALAIMRLTYDQVGGSPGGDRLGPTLLAACAGDGARPRPVGVGCGIGKLKGPVCFKKGETAPFLIGGGAASALRGAEPLPPRAHPICPGLLEAAPLPPPAPCLPHEGGPRHALSPQTANPLKGCERRRGMGCRQRLPRGPGRRRRQRPSWREQRAGRRPFGRALTLQKPLWGSGAVFLPLAGALPQRNLHLYPQAQPNRGSALILTARSGRQG